MFSAVFTDRIRPLPFRRSTVPPALRRFIKSQTALFFQFLPGNSRNSLVALQPFSSPNERIKILSSYDKGAIVTTVSTQYHSDVLTSLCLQRIINVLTHKEDLLVETDTIWSMECHLYWKLLTSKIGPVFLAHPVHTDGRTFETGFIRSTLSKSRPKNQHTCHVCVSGANHHQLHQSTPSASLLPCAVLYAAVPCAYCSTTYDDCPEPCRISHCDCKLQHHTIHLATLHSICTWLELQAKQTETASTEMVSDTWR